MSLLDDAKKRQKIDKSAIEVSDEELELVLAWINGEIQLIQFLTVLKTKSSMGYVKIARVIRHAVINHRIKIEVIK